MILLLIMGLVTAQQTNFGCLSVCRVPYFTCIQKGIPGHEIERLQQCVIDDRGKGIYDEKYPDCVKCIDNVRPVTDFPTAIITASPTVTPGTPEFCDKFSKRIKVCHHPDNTNGRCHWDSEKTKCIPGEPGGGPPPDLDTLQPCLKGCQEFALECNFSLGVPQSQVAAMRGCAYSLAEEKIEKLEDEGEDDDATKECKICLEDIFEVDDNPLDPPKLGFTIFNDYRKWVERQVTESRCTNAGGKFKKRDPSKPGKCVMNKASKLRCKNIKRMDVCKAVGCNIKNPDSENKKCNRRNRWK